MSRVRATPCRKALQSSLCEGKIGHCRMLHFLGAYYQIPRYCNTLNACAVIGLGMRTGSPSYCVNIILLMLTFSSD